MHSDDSSVTANNAWQKMMDRRIGVVPVPIAVALVLIVFGFLASGKLASDILVAIGVLGLGGFACAQLGRIVPALGRIGAPAIFATFLPSYLVYAHLLPAPLIKSISDFTKASNFLYLFIAAVIVGSILSMDRNLLLRGFLRVFPTLFGGSIAGFAVGMAVGTALGIEPHHLFFMVLVPIMGGGVGEGAIPLSVGYAAQGTPNTLGQLLPAVMLGGLTAILCAGALNMLGKVRPAWTGEGLLAGGGGDRLGAAPAAATAAAPPPAETVAAATMTIVTLYLAGALAQQLFGFPAPVAMLLLTVLIKLLRLASPDLEGGAAAVYRFFRVAVTYPLLFAIGIAMTPWQQILAALQPAMVITIVATVLTIIATGFVLAPWFGMHRIDVAIVNACHSGQGGTGDVAILTAGDRMALMPFAQIATRIGGAITVSIALLLHAHFGG